MIGILAAIKFKVCNKEEQEVLNRGSKKSDKLRYNLLNGKAIPLHQLPSVDQEQDQVQPQRKQLPHSAAAMDEGMERAIKHKNRLIEYDRSRCDLDILIKLSTFIWERRGWEGLG